MSGTTTAAVLSAYNEPLELQELSIPDPEPGALIVRNLRSTVCGADVHIRRGDVPGHSKIPLIPGHEVVGEVIESNGRTTDTLGRPLEPGDVIAWAYGFCGNCYWCNVSHQPTLCPNSRRYGWGPVNTFPHLTGGFAGHSYVMPECNVVKVPAGIDLGLAAAATCSLRTAMHANERVGGVSNGDTVVVQGAGPVGLWMTAIAALSGAAEVITIGAPNDRLQLARDWGATTTLSIEELDAAGRLAATREATSGRGADIVFECSGAPVAVDEGIELTRPGGRLALVGTGRDEAVPFTALRAVAKMLTILGVRSGHIGHYAAALDFIASNGDLPLERLLGTTYALADINTAIDAMEAMTEIKCVIDPTLDV